jgi:hypothetical protein
MSNGKWKGGILDELPIDLLPTGEPVHPAFDSYKRSGDQGIGEVRMLAHKRTRRK